MNNTFKALVIDDEIPLENIYTNFLAKVGGEVTFCDHPQKGWQAIDKQKFDLIITDLRMPAITGDEFIKIVRSSKLNSHTPIILCSAFINKLVITEMSRESKVYFLTKPFDSKALFELVDKAMGLNQVTTKEKNSQNDQWINAFTEKVNGLLGSSQVTKINNPEAWNFESVYMTIFCQEENGPVTVNLLMRTKTFLKVAGALQGTQYNEIENENLSIWKSFINSISSNTAKINFSRVLSHSMLTIPGQTQSSYKLLAAHEEMYIYIN